MAAGRWSPGSRRGSPLSSSRLMCGEPTRIACSLQWAGKEGDRSQKGLNHQPPVALPSDSQSGHPPCGTSRQLHRAARTKADPSPARRDQDDTSFLAERRICSWLRLRAALCYSSRQCNKRSDNTGSLILRGPLKSKPRR